MLRSAKAWYPTSKTQALLLLALSSTDCRSNLVRQWPVETEIGQPPLPEATLTPRPHFAARHAQDAVFERWSDRVLNVLAWDVLS